MKSGNNKKNLYFNLFSITNMAIFSGFVAENRGVVN
jgi:hypothetical protein